MNLMASLWAVLSPVATFIQCDRSDHCDTGCRGRGEGAGVTEDGWVSATAKARGRNSWRVDSRVRKCTKVNKRFSSFKGECRRPCEYLSVRVYLSVGT